MAKARAAKKRKNPGNPGTNPSTRSNPKKNTRSNFAVRTRRVNREWKKAKDGGSKIGRKAAWAKWG